MKLSSIRPEVQTPGPTRKRGRPPTPRGEIIVPPYKKCSSCKEVHYKDFSSHFGPRKKSLDGYQYICIPCTRRLASVLFNRRRQLAEIDRQISKVDGPQKRESLLALQLRKRLLEVAQRRKITN